MKTSKPSGPIVSTDILKAKKKDLSECYGVSKEDRQGQETGTIARLGDKMSIDAPTWRAMSATHKDDVWEYACPDKTSGSKNHTTIIILKFINCKCR
ncbi:hypothetical protein Taro_035905, partial [Colocasia esculenta]|nr:hypothetical protein [Colocasia esculenta]